MSHRLAALGLSKAGLAQRADMVPEAARPLLSKACGPRFGQLAAGTKALPSTTSCRPLATVTGQLPLGSAFVSQMSGAGRAGVDECRDSSGECGGDGFAGEEQRRKAT